MCHRCSACQLLLSRCSSSDDAAGLQKKETDLTARQAALQDGEQQLHAEKAGLGALEAALKVCSANQYLACSASVTFVPVVQLQDYCHAAAVAILFACASTAACCFLVVVSLHDRLSVHAFLDGCSLGHLAQQEHSIELFERPVQEEYEVKSKECEAAAVNSKKELAAVVKERNALQQQLKVSCVGSHLVHSCCLLQCCRDCSKRRCLQLLGFKL